MKMVIKEEKDIEIHAFWDIPSVMLASVKVLIERKDEKTYIIIITKRKGG